MKIEDVRRMLIPADKVGSLEYNNFGEACRDPQASIFAVNDFESFKRIIAASSTRKTREDRLHRLYGLYLSLSKARLAVSKEAIERFKATVPGYERVSTHLFVKDILYLINHSVAILSTPVLDAIRIAETAKSELIALQKRAIGKDEPPAFTASCIDGILKSRIRT